MILVSGCGHSGRRGHATVNAGFFEGLLGLEFGGRLTRWRQIRMFREWTNLAGPQDPDHVIHNVRLRRGYATAE